MQHLTALFAGLVLGTGLIISGMGNPAKVLAFLDLAGAWDPSLAFVMGGAILLALPAFMLLKQRQRSLLGLPLQLPTNRQLDARLLGGSALFGIGWGIAGICPGPGLLLIGTGAMQGVIFVIAMLAGMALHEYWQKRSSQA